ncbi:NUDIX hydrolase [Candidatus Uhrbacteria bacterium]|nr:NUDIX hydrolase [Candidatus Uhrbacteria bacterium]
MDLKPWKTLSSEVINENHWSSYIHNTFETPDGHTGDYYYMKTPVGSVMVVPVLSDGRLVLHREYRYIFNRISLAFPSGGIEVGQSALEAVVVELKEESGYSAKSIEMVAKLAPSTGILQEYTTYFFATDLEAGETQPEEAEEFEQVLMTIEEVDEAISSGEVWDGFTVCAWQLMRERVVNYRNTL